MRLLLVRIAVVVSSPLLVQADNWPQWMGPKRDNVWREDGLLEKFPEGGPRSRVAHAGRGRIRGSGGGRRQGVRHATTSPTRT